jgi:uncharacterized glyoxalase superfamily protein PhnB
VSTSVESSGTADRSVSSSVEVAVDADTAFAAFTDEVDLWWVRGPINHFNSGRLRAVRIEPGVGGRLLEIYDESAGDELEMARITDWQPGRRIAWQSTLDDVRTEVSFEASAGGTVVRVTATIPSGGRDAGGTAWVRVVPKWFGAWCTARDSRPHEVVDLARLAVGVSYARPAAAARWLAEAFGFQSPDPLPLGTDPLSEGEHGHPWIEFRLGNSSLMIFKLPDGPSGQCASHLPWVYVDDIDEHYRGAREAGAKIENDLASPWGLPMYVAADPEGYQWTFAQARPTMR